MAAARALGSSREPEEWIKATEAARSARVIVGGQVADLLVAADTTGGREMLSRRLRECSEAERTGDLDVIRAAYMSAAVEFAAMCVSIDLRQSNVSVVAATIAGNGRRAAA